jgi:hypothetical protein
MRSIRVPDDEWTQWQAIADSKGMALIAWMRDTLNRAAKRAKR